MRYHTLATLPKKQLKEATHLELGCMPSAEKIQEWVSKGTTTCLGIDLDLSPSNKYMNHILKNMNYRDIVKPTQNPEHLSRIVEANVLDVLRLIGDRQIQYIDAQMFFSSIESNKLKKKISRETGRVLGENATILLSCGKIALRQAIAGIKSSRNTTKIEKGGNIIDTNWGKFMSLNPKKNSQVYSAEVTVE